MVVNKASNCYMYTSVNGCTACGVMVRVLALHAVRVMQVELQFKGAEACAVCLLVSVLQSFDDLCWHLLI